MRQETRLDNVALVPASFLPFKAAYQKVANRLPTGEILIVLPSSTTKQRDICEKVVFLLRAKGQWVGTVQQKELL